MNNLETGEKASPRTLVLLYAADLFFRLRWEIIPALDEGKCVVAVPYLETGFAFGTIAGLPKKWLREIFRFAPPAGERFHMNGSPSYKLGAAPAGCVELCCTVI